MSLEAVQALFPGARPVTQFPNLYATPEGWIISARRRKPRRLGSYVIKRHCRVNVRYQGRNYTPRVHQMVCCAFYGPKPSPDHKALHRNGISTDNRVENLYWGTAQDLVDGQMIRGTKPRGERHKMHKLTEAQVIEIKRLLTTTTLTHLAIAEQFGVCKGTVTGINMNRSWKHLWADPTQTPTTATAQGTCPPPEGRATTLAA